MAWTIHHWSAEHGIGAISSPHFGPISFDASANVDNVADFREGEAVWVDLEGEPPAFRAVTVRPLFQRQPADTRWEPFDIVNGRYGDAAIEEHSSDALQIWLGDCCQYCTPNPARIKFESVTSVHGLDQDVEFCSPFFRLASATEVGDYGLLIPSDSKAFCIVTSHGQGLDGALIFVVAQSVRVQPTDSSV